MVNVSYDLVYDLGGTNLLASIVESTSKKQTVLESISEPTKPYANGDELVAHFVNLGKAVLTKTNKDPSILNSVAAATPGRSSNGVFIHANAENFKNCDRTDLAGGIQAAFKVAFYCGNDGDLAHIGERTFRKMKGQKVTTNSIFFIFGTGVGGSLADKYGKTKSGTHNGINMEVGHMPLYHGKNARKCTCGNIGCFEAHVSSRSLEEISKEKYAGEANAPSWVGSCKDIYAAVRENNDPEALELITEQIAGCARGIRVVSVNEDPGLVLLSGQIMKSADIFIPILRAEMAKYIPYDPGVKTEIQVAIAGDNAPFYGGANLWRQNQAQHREINRALANGSYSRPNIAQLIR